MTIGYIHLVNFNEIHDEICIRYSATVHEKHTVCLFEVRIIEVSLYTQVTHINGWLTKSDASINFWYVGSPI